MTDDAANRIVRPPTVVLDAANFKLRSSITAPDASPFLGHHILDDAQKERMYAALGTLTHSDVERFIQLFRRCPFVCSWVVSTAVAESYGQDGDTRIYDHIQHKIGCLSISPSQRQSLNRAFREICLRFGLPVVQRLNDGNDSFVDDYVVQAGVAHNQLRHLAAAFLRGELEFGPPPVDDTVQLSSWAQESVQQFMTTNLPRPRRVISHDDVGFHAAVYARISRSVAMDTSFEQAFGKALEEARQTFSARAGQIAPRPPVLVFSDGELSLENPNLGLSTIVSINGRDRTLAPNSRLGLGSPWPPFATFRIGDIGPNNVEIVGTDDLLAFDPENGRLLRRAKPDALSMTLDAVGVILVCSRPFTAGEDESFPVGREAHALYVSLENPIQVQFGSRQISLNMLDRPRIIVDGDAVASASGAPLTAAPSSVRIFASADLLSQKMIVRVEHPALSAPIELPVIKNEAGEYRAILNELPTRGHFGPLRVSLFISGQQRTIAKTLVWYWPGLSQLDTGVVFDAPIPPNFDKEASRNVAIGTKGQLELIEGGGYLTAHVAFTVGNGRVVFSIPKPGLTLSVSLPNLPERPVTVGADLLIADSLDGSLVIRTPDHEASLDVCGRHEQHAFANSGVRRISMASLLSKESHNRIRFLPKGDALLAYDILTIVGATDPEMFELAPQADVVRVQMKFHVPVDAVRVEFRHVNSDQLMLSETALGRRPVDIRPLPSLVCSQRGADRTDVSLRIDETKFRKGEWLASIKVREEGKEGWQPITNERLDEFSFAFRGHLESSTDDDVTANYLRLDQALMRCFAMETWPSIERAIVPAWKTAGTSLGSANGGRWQLVKASGHAPPATASPSWIPILHPLELAPDLYECPPEAFLVLSDSQAEGADHVARLGKLAGYKRVREALSRVSIHPVLLMGFSNWREADKKDWIQLKRFDFSQFAGFAETIEPDPEGTFWAPHRDWLTLAHHSWCCARIIERVRRVAPDGSSANEKRMPGAAHLALACSRLPGAQALRAPERLSDELSLIEYTGAALSAFARACRRHESAGFWDEVARRTDRSKADITRSMGFLLRIAPELFAFYLILWELVTKSEQ
jgi:hypothetical protein